MEHAATNDDQERNGENHHDRVRTSNFLFRCFLDLRIGEGVDSIYAAFLFPTFYHRNIEEGTARKDQKDDERRKIQDIKFKLVSTIF